jgi:uroporphyrinogen decarboxylase
MTDDRKPQDPAQPDGIHAMVPRDRMCEAARKRRDTYAITPGLPFLRTEMGYFCLDAWKEQGLPEDANFAELFHYEATGDHGLGELGWCEAALLPAFDVTILEDLGDHELVQDYAGRKVLYFKGRRDGFMPEYVDHPVKDMKTWEENLLWRLDPADSRRFANLDERMAQARAAAGQGLVIVQNLIGGYMYLRSLIGPADLLYAFVDQPDLIHACMRAWLDLADTVLAGHQQHVTIDEIFFGEDICYNHGPLISPAMMWEFILPYYQQLIANLKSRQIDKSRHLYVQIDTDGFCVPTIPVYREAIGMDVMSPMEVASGCDVVQIGRDWPGLVIKGGIDKRVLAKGRKAIDEMLERIFPVMRARGGYTPHCDHGVPAEVPLADYIYYRDRAVELGG